MIGSDIKKTIKYFINKFRYRSLVDFDQSVDISMSSSFEGCNNIYSRTKFSGYLGYRTYIGDNCIFNGKVGRFSSIGPFVHVNEGRHPYESPYVSTSPVFVSPNKRKGISFVDSYYYEEKKFADEENKFAVIIGNDCWIGQGCFLVGGVTIGDGAVVLARSVVTENIPPYAIVGGIPAKILRYRYDEGTIKFLLNFKWWNKTDNWLKENHKLMIDIEALKKKYL